MENPEKKVNDGLSLVNAILECSKYILSEHCEIDDNGDVEHISPEDVFFYLMEDEYLGDELEKVVVKYYDKLSDEVTYEERQAWRDKRELRRTDRQDFVAEKNRTANKINRRYNS